MILLKRSMAAALSALPVLAQAQFAAPVGPQSILWEGSNNLQAPAVALAAGRDAASIAVWNDEWFGMPVLRAQRFAADGAAIGAPIDLTGFVAPDTVFAEFVTTIDAQGIASIAYRQQSNEDGGDIRLVRVGVDGQLLGPAVTVNTTTVGTQSRPSIASDSLNHVLVTWTGPVTEDGFGVFGQLFNGGGGFQFDEHRVDGVAQAAPVQSIAMLGDCCEVSVAWRTSTADDDQIRARVFGLSWQAWTDEATLVTFPNTVGIDQFDADVDFQGRVRVVWLSSNGSIFHQPFDVSLQPLVTMQGFNPPQSPDEQVPIRLGLTHDGSFLLGWQHTESPGRTRNVLARFDDQGQQQDELLVLDDLIPDNAVLQAMAVDLDGDPVLAWHTGQEWLPMRTLRVGRFGGPPNVMFQLSADNNIEVVAPGTLFDYQPRAWNLSEAGTRAEIGLVTGARVEIDLDDALVVEQLEAQPGWNCSAAQTIVCTTPALAAGENALPVRLGLRAPAQSPLTLRNRLVASQLETSYFPESQQSMQDIVVADGEPDPIMFATRTNVPRHVLVASETIAVTGFDTPISIYIFNGDVSTNGGLTWGSSTLYPGDSLTLRHYSAPGFASTSISQLRIGNQDVTFTSVSEARDLTPDSFAFIDAANVPRSSVQNSNSITVAGINDATAISVAGGEYRINGGAFTSVAGTLTNGAVVELRHTSAAAFSTATQSTLTIGNVTASFTSTTEAMDTTPNAFSFVDQTGLATNVLATSAPVAVMGTNAASPITISGGSYSINGGSFTTAAGSINTGDQVRVQLTTASTANTPASATLTISGVSDTFTATTGSIDSTPASYSFADVVGARRNRSTISNTITMTGINVPVAITLTGADLAYSKNGAKFTAAPGTVVAGDQIRLRMTSSTLPNTRVDGTVTIGGISDIWSITTSQ